MRADRTGGVAEAGLTQDGLVEQPFQQAHRGETADGPPGEQSPFRTRQQTVGKRCADTAAVQVDDLAVLAAGENDASAESIAAMVIDQADLQQQIERRAPSGQMTPEVSASSVTDAELLDQGGVTQAAVLQIACCFRMVMELELVKGGGLLQQLGNGSGRQCLFEKRHRLAERQIEEGLDQADQVAAASTAVE